MKINAAKHFRMHRSAKLSRSLQIATLVVSTILGMALMAAGPAHVAAQVDDTTPPELTAFTFTPETIDTTSGSATVTLTLSCTDDLSGVSSFYISFVGPSGQGLPANWGSCSGESCTASHEVGFPQYIEAGIWKVSAVQVYDAIGNYRYYYTDELSAMGFPTQLLNTQLVNYDFSGFFQPVDNLPTMNVAKAGSAIPVKWSLGSYQGMDICAPGYPASAPIASDPTQVADVIEQTVTAGSSGLRYDAAADQYIYVWATEKAWAGTSRQLVIKLKDGTYHRANFRFTK